MNLYTVWFSILPVLVLPTCLAHPSNTRPQSRTLTNDINPGIISQVNLTNLVQDYPVYPTTCFPPPSHGSRRPASEITDILTDCYWIINKVLLREDSLLFQDLIFNYNFFTDQAGNRYLSQWQRGRCAINVGCVGKGEEQTLQLFNVVLAANKILRECVEDKRIPGGGTTAIGSPSSSFHVGVVGRKVNDAAHELNNSFPSNLHVFGQDIQRSLLHTNPNAESSIKGYGTTDATISLPPNVSREKRASNPQHESSLSTGTQSLAQSGAASNSNRGLSSTNLSKRLDAPPDYPVHCFNPYSVKLKVAAVEDCQFVINHIILEYPNPMHLQTFGYSPSADIDLSLPQNEKWVFGHCVMFVRNTNKSRTDTFRMVDVALTAHRIMTQCVVGVKYPVGGTADVGPVGDNFYVGVGGLSSTDATNNTSTLQQFSSIDGTDDRIGTHGTL